MESRHPETLGNQHQYQNQDGFQHQARGVTGSDWSIAPVDEKSRQSTPSMTAGYETMSLAAAEIIAAQLKAKPDSCLGLPTGRSPIGCYRLLTGWSGEQSVDWSQANCFALDDYLGANEEMTFQTFLETNLYRFTNLPDERKHNPRFVDDYDALIASCGGLDLVVLGLGANGHIAFNEPGTPKESWTHCIWLTESTRKANQGYFKSGAVIPETAVTMGISTIMSSRRVLLMVSGEQKKDLLASIQSGHADESIPASFLLTHPSLSIICDFAQG